MPSRLTDLVLNLLIWYRSTVVLPLDIPISTPSAIFPPVIYRGTKNRNSMASNTYNQGAQVEHQKFGLGQVVSSSEERIVIKFDDHGEKKFVTAMVMASLKKSDRQPPTEKKGARKKKVVPVAV